MRAHRKYLLPVLVAGGLVALCAPVILSIYWGVSQQSEFELQAERLQNQFSRAIYTKELNNCLYSATGNQLDCASRAQGAARAYQIAEQDLAAQKTMAVWTSLMGGAALAGLLLSTAGAVLVFTTFNATREANQIARDQLVTANRAYLVVQHFDFGIYSSSSGRESNARVSFGLTNKGITPAFEVETNVWLSIRRYGRIVVGPLVCTPSPDSAAFIGEIAAGDPARFDFRATDPKLDIFDRVKLTASATSDAPEIVVGVAVKLRDAFTTESSQKHALRFWYLGKAKDGNSAGNNMTRVPNPGEEYLPMKE